MLLRLVYLAATNILAILRLLTMSGCAKDIEILALRHQLLVLQREVGKPTFTATDRALLAGLPANPTTEPGREVSSVCRSLHKTRPEATSTSRTSQTGAGFWTPSRKPNRKPASTSRLRRTGPSRAAPPPALHRRRPLRGRSP
ncbi:hypothetical protein ACFYRJ_39375 [Streptomyces sp. NPDC005531]|uniref:hypothetical protein n=1 Tax=Streptomyces sp. NPDC005531 TaxID=3364722 RepID=UPI0036BC294F